MPARPVIEANINSFLGPLIGSITAGQATYRSSRGGRGANFWQGIVSSTPPDDGALIPPVLSRKPAGDANADRKESWAEFGTNSPVPIVWPATWPASLRVDEYLGPRGAGWELTATYTKAGRTYARRHHIGPENERNRSGFVDETPPPLV
jgi:hypothetical protein